MNFTLNDREVNFELDNSNVDFTLNDGVVNFKLNIAVDTPSVGGFFRLLETGFYRLLESGDRRLLETAPVIPSVGTFDVDLDFTFD